MSIVLGHDSSKPARPQSQKQKIHRQYAWNILQIKGSTGQLKQVCSRLGIVDGSEIRIWLNLIETDLIKINHAWKQYQTDRLKEGKPLRF